jgi:two-component system, NarL family, sensor histidine kinase DesK
MHSRVSQTWGLAEGDPASDWDVAPSSEVAAAALPPATSELPGVRVARLVLWGVLCGYAIGTAASFAATPSVSSDAGKLAVAYAGIAVILVVQAVNSSAAAQRWPAWRRWAMLAIMAAATYLPLPVLGTHWQGLAGFLAGSLLLVVPGRAGWALFTAVVASTLVISALVYGPGAYIVAYETVSTLAVGLFVFGLSRLSQVIRYVHAARGELAQLAIVRERVRFARDLHDLLGYSLSAITLKAELARRLVAANPGRSRDEIAELLDIARQALADVRTVSSGYRNISLSKEAASVASLLTAAGIEARVEISCGPLDERVDTVLATVVRESVTNMLRHSTARACSIEAHQAGEVIQLRMLNDGISRSAATSRRGGGLENLAARLEAIGGRLTATVRDGQFDLLAEAPASPPQAGSAPPATAATETY